MSANRLPESKPSTDEYIDVLIFVKGEHKWVFMWKESQRVELLRHMGRMAADKSLPFSWYDCAIVAKRIRESPEFYPKESDEQ